MVRLVGLPGSVGLQVRLEFVVGYLLQSLGDGCYDFLGRTGSLCWNEMTETPSCVCFVTHCLETRYYCCLSVVPFSVDVGQPAG